MPEVSVDDLIDEASYVADSSGVKVTRKFLITGLNDNAPRKLYQAAMLPDLPQRGQAHPNIPNLVVETVSIQPAPSSPTKAHATVVYQTISSTNITPSEGAEATLDYGATISSVERDRDKNGDEMILTYDGRDNQPFIANVQAAFPYLTLSRREPKPFNTLKVKQFVGAVNSVPWIGDPARTWLCSAIRATLDGDAFRVNYEFQFNRFTWDVIGVYFDESKGKPIVNPVTGQGRKTFYVYSEEDFALLNLGV